MPDHNICLRRRALALLTAAALLLPLLAGLPARAADSAAPLDESFLAAQEQIAADDGLACDFAGLCQRLTAMADAESAGGWRAADSARADAWDALAARAGALLAQAEQAAGDLGEPAPFADGRMLAAGRCCWQLARMDRIARRNDDYDARLRDASWLYGLCLNAVETQIDNPLADADFLLACCADADNLPDGTARALLDRLRQLDEASGTQEFTDWYADQSDAIDELLGDSGAPLRQYPNRGVWSLDGSARQIGEIVYDGEIPYVDLTRYLAAFGGIDRGDYTDERVQRGEQLDFLLYGDEISASAGGITLNGESVELTAPLFAAGGRLYAALDDADYLAYAVPQQQTLSYYANSCDEQTTEGTVTVLRPYYGEGVEVTDAQLSFLEGVGAPINLQNYLYDNDIDASLAGSAREVLSGLCGYARGAASAGSARQLLSDSWEITDADSLRRQFDWLLTEGHRGTFNSEVQAGVPGWFAQKWGLNPTSNTSFAAWDLARAVQIAQWGCCAGYLAPPEALALELQAARLLQQQFDSWQSFAADYLMGYDVFLGADAQQDAYTATRLTVMQQIYADGTYLGTPWQTELDVGGTAADSGAADGERTAAVKAAQAVYDGGAAALVLVLALALLDLAAAAVALPVTLGQNRKRRRAEALFANRMLP